MFQLPERGSPLASVPRTPVTRAAGAGRQAGSGVQGKGTNGFKPKGGCQNEGGHTSIQTAGGATPAANLAAGPLAQ